MTDKLHIKLTVNGQEEEFLAEPRELLIYTLRERLNITGPHIGCETSHCGACTITMDGKSVKACTVFIGQANGADVTTIRRYGRPRCASPAAKRVQRASWFAMWLLHAGNDHPCGKTARGKSIPNRRRHTLWKCRETCAAAPVIKILSNPFSPLRLR